MSDVETLSLQDASALLHAAFLGGGVPDAAARSVAGALVAAEAEGQVGHGFSRLGDYLAQVATGKIKAGAEATVTVRGPSALHVDAGHGFAFPALDLAFERGIQTASESFVSAVTVAHSHHCGALSVQVDRIARAGFVALMVANTPAAMAPWGGDTRLFGTNPIAFAAPRAGADPLVIDLSLSKVARGKIMNAKKTGQAIPEGWALDPSGNPTTDAEAALAGSMLPIGDAKGTALALMVEVLAATLPGVTGSADMSSFLNPDGPPPDAGQFLLILKPGETGFVTRLEALLTRISEMDGARLPGSRRVEALRKASEKGLKVPTQYLDVARSWAEKASG